mgnify:CR=1 FL=1
MIFLPIRFGCGLSQRLPRRDRRGEDQNNWRTASRIVADVSSAKAMLVEPLLGSFTFLGKVNVGIGRLFFSWLNRGD